MGKLLLIMIGFFSPTLVQAQFADETVEELTYEDLVEQLSTQKRRVQMPSQDPFESVKIHAGMAMVNSFSTFRINDKNTARYQNGLQIALGVDLLTESWFAEAAFRNFGLNREGSEEHRLRELDLKFGHRAMIEGPWFYRFQAGLAHRQLRIEDALRGTQVEATTPALLGSAGIGVQMGPLLSLGLDLGARVPVIDRTADKGSFDFALELKASL